MSSGRMPACSSLSFSTERDPPLLGREHRAEMRLEPAAYRDVDDEQRRHHEARKDSCEPELADRLAGDHAVEHQHHARGHQDSERAAGLDHPGDHDLVVVAAQQLGECDGRPDRHAGHAQPVHRGDDHHETDGADGESAPDRPEPHVEHPVEIVRDSGLGEHEAHVDEHRQGEQRIPLHQLHRSREGHLAPTIAPQRERRDGRDRTDRGKDSLPGDEHQHHRGEHQQRDHLVAH